MTFSSRPGLCARARVLDAATRARGVNAAGVRNGSASRQTRDRPALEGTRRLDAPACAGRRFEVTVQPVVRQRRANFIGRPRHVQSLLRRQRRRRGPRRKPPSIAEITQDERDRVQCHLAPFRVFGYRRALQRREDTYARAGPGRSASSRSAARSRSRPRCSARSHLVDGHRDPDATWRPVSGRPRSAGRVGRREANRAST